MSKKLFNKLIQRASTPDPAEQDKQRTPKAITEDKLIRVKLKILRRNAVVSPVNRTLHLT